MAPKRCSIFYTSLPCVLRPCELQSNSTSCPWIWFYVNIELPTSFCCRCVTCALQGSQDSSFREPTDIVVISCTHLPPNDHIGYGSSILVHLLFLFPWFLKIPSQSQAGATWLSIGLPSLWPSITCFCLSILSVLELFQWWYQEPAGSVTARCRNSCWSIVSHQLAWLLACGLWNSFCQFTFSRFP